MTPAALLVKKRLLQNGLNWFQADFNASIVSPLRTHFPGYPLPREVQSVLEAQSQIV